MLASSLLLVLSVFACAFGIGVLYGVPFVVSLLVYLCCVCMRVSVSK